MKWHKNYAAIDPRSGRVLFIDFAKKGSSFPLIYPSESPKI